MLCELFGTRVPAESGDGLCAYLTKDKVMQLENADLHSLQRQVEKRVGVTGLKNR